MWARLRQKGVRRNAADFIAVDHCSFECVSIHAAHRGTRYEALEPIRQAVKERFGAFACNIAPDTAIRHDHGSADMSRVLQ